MLSFVSTSFSTQHQPLFVFLQSEAGSNNKRDKTKLCKYQSRESIFVSEIDKYIVSFFFDDNGLKLSLLNEYLFKFSQVKYQYETRKKSNFYLTIRFTKPPA